MFMQRVITSLILVPLVLLSILYAPAMALLAVAGLVLILAGTECWQLVPVTQPVLKAGFLLLLLAALWLCGQFYLYWLSIGLMLWGFICVAILTFPESQRYWGYPLLVAGVCLFLLALFFHSMVYIYNLREGKSLFIYLLFLVWAADIGAYLAGKLWGKHKLIPAVSPGKSWEGALGGYALALLVTAAGFWFFTPYSLVLWCLLTFFIVTISIFGDLFISILKRRCQLKDTGHLIPGHGGILDRLDSLIAAAPVFYFGLIYIPVGI